jgi:DNA-binding MarR family transcriptional regulator/catechol 2,3-dioxygenase-like lactoylglutathione lyase family enzyme
MTETAVPESLPFPLLLLRAGATYATAMRTALAAAGFDDIPRNGLYVIGGLGARGRPCPLAELIGQLKLSKQAMGQLADALVSNGYLQRQVDTDDRRRLTVSLTERGRAAARVLTAARTSVEARLLEQAGQTDIEHTRRTLALLGSVDRATAKTGQDRRPVMNLDNARESLRAENCDLTDSRFSNVGLAGATFDNIDLQRAVFNDINLAGATLHDVNLENVCVTDANTKGMTINGVAVLDLLHSGRDHPGNFAQVMPVLKVADIQRSIDWYTGVLGMTLLWRKPQESGESCMLAEGRVTLMLSTGDHLGGTPAFTGTLYFNMADARAFHERLDGRVEMVWPLEAMNYGTTEFGIRDPDGYVLAFASR